MRKSLALFFVCLSILSGAIAMGADEIQNINTIGGILKIRNKSDHYAEIIFKNKIIHKTNTSKIRVQNTFSTLKGDVMLILEDTGGNLCAGIFRFIMINKGGAYNISRYFGNCHATPKVWQEGEKIVVDFPYINDTCRRVTAVYDKGAVKVTGMTPALEKYLKQFK